MKKKVNFTLKIQKSLVKWQGNFFENYNIDKKCVDYLTTKNWVFLQMDVLTTIYQKRTPSSSLNSPFYQISKWEGEIKRNSKQILFNFPYLLENDNSWWLYFNIVRLRIPFYKYSCRPHNWNDREKMLPICVDLVACERGFERYGGDIFTSSPNNKG